MVPRANLEAAVKHYELQAAKAAELQMVVYTLQARNDNLEMANQQLDKSRNSLGTQLAYLDRMLIHSLDEEQLGVIVDIQLKAVAKRLAAQQLTMEITDDAKRHLAKAGYDPQFGARPLKRTVQELLLNPLATRLLDGEYKPGDNIRINVTNDELTFEK